jgi:hypothetical protein
VACAAEETLHYRPVFPAAQLYINNNEITKWLQARKLTSTQIKKY